MSKQTNQEKLKEQVAQLKLELADVKEANKQHVETITLLAKQKGEIRLNFFRVCNALQAIQNSVVTAQGILRLDDIELSFSTRNDFFTEPRS